jgi:hypothetical protein
VDEVRGRAGSDGLGPVQILLIGIDRDGADQMLEAELQDLRTQDGVRVLDLLLVRRGYDDEVRRLDPVDLEGHSGALAEALLVVDPDEPEPPAERRLRIGQRGEDAWFLADRLPCGAAAAILLIEHRWAIPLREAAAESEAEIFGDAWVHPRDLAAARLRASGHAG